MSEDLASGLFKQRRKSKMFLEEVYFWTDTIKDWKCLLHSDSNKDLVISSLKYLVDKGLMKIYAFVIMPNHIHLVWKMLAKNGKEMPHASFNKFTAHQFQKGLRQSEPYKLEMFKVNEPERSYRFWQRDALAVLMDSREKVEQKIDYIHLNPLQKRWSLVECPEDYPWSSAAFYATGEDRFGLLTHYLDEF